MNQLVGGIEAGGTKFVCAVGTGPDDLRAEVRFPTTAPEETIDRAIDFFRQQQGEHGPLAAIGIGPLDRSIRSPARRRTAPSPRRPSPVGETPISSAE